MIAILISSAFPLIVIGNTILLITRIGWVAIIGVILVLLQLPLSNMISQKNGKTVEEINKFKDKRVQITS